MSRHCTRRGLTLIEMLVALLLVMAIAAIAGASTQRVIAVQSRTAAYDSRRTALSDALATLARQLAATDVTFGDLRTARDTVVDLVHTVGSTTVCRASGDTLVVSAGADTVPWSSTLPRTITGDDRVRVWHEGRRQWVERRVLAATSTAGACGDSVVPWPDRATQRLILDSTLIEARPGLPVRVVQRARWTLVRGADGQWSLALATWDAARATFTTPQPLIAPMAAPSARTGAGFSVRALDSAGGVLPDSGLARAVAIVVTLRYANAARLGVIADSVRIDVGTR